MREKLIELLTDNLPRIGDLPKCDNPLQYTMDEIVGRIADHLIANGVTIQQWIPVTERLPEEHTLVLCVGAKGGMFLGYPSMIYGNDTTAFTVVPNSRGERQTKYWMPLPELPKGE